MTVAEMVRRLKAVQQRPSRIADYLREPRDIVVGGYLANRCGLQVARAAKDDIAWRLRSKRVEADISSLVDDIARSGYVVIPNFLQDQEFALVRAEYDKSRTEPFIRQYRRVRFGENYFMDDLLVTDYPRHYPAMHRWIRDSELLARAAAAVARRRVTYRPHIHIQRISKENWSAPHTDLDYNQFAHTDRYFPFVKCFYYLDDVTEENAPYSYAPGSHTMTLRRLQYEYEYSVRYVQVRRAAQYDRSIHQLEADAGLRDLSERYLADVGSTMIPLTGRANTMVISNNQGFHKRGEFRGQRPRVIAQLDFKYLESPAQWMHPLLKHLYDD